jgi:hypothetical protein
MYNACDKVKTAISNGTTYGVWVECTDSSGNTQVIRGDSVFSLSGETQSTSLSDDIELGAVCSKMITLNLLTEDSGSGFVGQTITPSLYAMDRSQQDGTTYGALEQYKYSKLSEYTVSELATIGEIMGGELIPRTAVY